VAGWGRNSTQRSDSGSLFEVGAATAILQVPMLQNILQLFFKKNILSKNIGHWQAFLAFLWLNPGT